MAAIGPERKARIARALCAVLVVLNTLPQPAAADASSDARKEVTAVAEALSSGDAAEAMTHFSKSLPDYEKLQRRFEGLAAFQVENQLNFTDEEDSDNSVVLTITWDITLTDLGTDTSIRRTGEIHAKVARENSKWRIVEFTPLDIFNPQLRG